MTVVALKDILDPAFSNRYGVAAINIVDDLTLRAVLDAAAELRAPIIIQTSLKTVKSIGADILSKIFRVMAEPAPVPVALHLDHCPDRAWISTCLKAGWNSVLFDGSHLDVAENTRQTKDVVREAVQYGAQVEGEIETVQGVEDDIGSDDASAVFTVDISSQFIAETGVYCFAPAVGTAHGLYTKAPHLMPERVTELVARQPVPMVLHGGTGLTREQFSDLISRGCAKINISTALKIAYVEGYRDYLEKNPKRHDPPSLIAHVHAAVKAVVREHLLMLGCENKADMRP